MVVMVGIIGGSLLLILFLYGVLRLIGALLVWTAEGVAALAMAAGRALAAELPAIRRHRPA